SANGIITTTLGSTTPLSLPFDKQYWLGIKVGSENELAPRMKLSSTAYSMRADTAEYAKASQQQSIVDIDTLKINGAIGIGISNPAHHLSIQSSDNSTSIKLANTNSSGIAAIDLDAQDKNFHIKTENKKFVIRDQTEVKDVFTIDASGNVGIGTNSPTRQLHVNGSSRISELLEAKTIIAGHDSTIGNLYLDGGFSTYLTASGYGHDETLEIWTGSGANSPSMVVSPVGYVGIGTTNPTEKLVVCGNIKASGTITTESGICSPSDRRLKKSVYPIDSAIDKVTNLQGVSYQWDRESYPERNMPEGNKIGLIAQEVEEVIPEIVHTDSKGYKSLEYDKLAAVLIEAIKEQQSQIETLKKQVSHLQQTVESNSH
ncbi:MAG: hypothetical protein GF398_20230, partial [Chitinivibrionales bacterium]|nr:hypothetical protein [Chitinivibrionales bacterium]